MKRTAYDAFLHFITQNRLWARSIVFTAPIQIFRHHLHLCNLPCHYLYHRHTHDVVVDDRTMGRSVRWSDRRLARRPVLAWMRHTIRATTSTATKSTAGTTGFNKCGTCIKRWCCDSVWMTATASVLAGRHRRPLILLENGNLIIYIFSKLIALFTQISYFFSQCLKMCIQLLPGVGYIVYWVHHSPPEALVVEQSWPFYSYHWNIISVVMRGDVVIIKFTDAWHKKLGAQELGEHK